MNVGRPRTLKVGPRVKETGIFKEPVAGRTHIRGEAVGDDVQMDRRYHGGPYKAVYAYAAEDLDRWSEELGVLIPPGTFGENLTVQGIDVSGALIGERWRVGTAELEVTEPRVPCSTLATKMRDSFGLKGFVKTFVRARRFGAYLSIAEEGDVAPGDDVRVLFRPDHGVTITDIADLVYAPDLATAVSYLEVFPTDEQKKEWMRFIREISEKET